MKNSMPVMRPWATMPKMAALMPKSVRVEMPSITNPMCATDERDQALHVGLGKTAEGAVDDADDGSRPITGAQPRRLREASGSRCG